MFLKNKNFFDDPAPLKERTEKTDGKRILWKRAEGLGGRKSQLL